MVLSAVRICGKTSEAWPLVKRLLLVDPLMPINNFLPGILHWFDGNLRDAVQPFAKAYQMDPENFHTQFWYAYILASNDRKQEVLSILNLLPDNAPAITSKPDLSVFKICVKGGKGQSFKVCNAGLEINSKE